MWPLAEINMAIGMTDRKLSDEDIKSLGEELERRMVQRFYSDLGRGVWGLIWKAIMAAALTLAAYGAWKGGAG